MDIIAHRGASAAYVENSMLAFQAALTQGADGIEVDLRRSVDGEIYCFHDHKLSRLTRGTGYFRRVQSEKIDKLQLRDGSSIPKFRDFAKEYVSNTRVVLDIKSARIEPQIIEILGELAKDPRLVYSSFNPNILRRIRKELPAARMALIVGPVRNVSMRLKIRTSLVKRLRKLDCQAVHISRLLAGEGLVKHLKNEGFAISVWTVDDPQQARKLADTGIDSLMTNDPARIVEGIRSR